jgi:hypothetical protein
MDPDRRALFEAAFGALMIRTARPRPSQSPATGCPEPSSNTLPSPELGSGPEANRGAR